MFYHPLKKRKNEYHVVIIFKTIAQYKIFMDFI